MRADNGSFEIGDRVCLSELGESHLRKPRSKAGKVVGFGFSKSRIRVLFDGLSEPTTLHHSYLKKEQKPAGHAKDDRPHSEVSGGGRVDRFLFPHCCTCRAATSDLDYEGI